MAQIDFLPIATGSGANVVSQGDFAGSGFQTEGFTSGIALSGQLNKCWRQPSTWSAVLANFVSQQLGNIDVLDNGDISGLLANFIAALQATIENVANPSVINVTYSTTPVFDCSLGNVILPVFYLDLTGPVTSSTIDNVRPGQLIVIIVNQPSGGGQAFVAPANLPMGAISQAGSSFSSQMFMALSPTGFVPMGSIVVS